MVNNRFVKTTKLFEKKIELASSVIDNKNIKIKTNVDRLLDNIKKEQGNSVIDKIKKGLN